MEGATYETTELTELNLSRKMLRDLFAMASLAGHRSNSGEKDGAQNGQIQDDDDVAKWAYADADAMLAERERHADE